MTPTENSGTASVAQGWLNARAAGVPEALMERIRAAAAECFGNDGARSGDVGISGHEGTGEDADRQVRAFFRVIREQLSTLRTQACEERKEALDLLTADALLTYALEFVAEARPDALRKYAVELMRMVGEA